MPKYDKANVVDIANPKANMYGCLPCPKCGSEFRTPQKSGWIKCDDCGYGVTLTPLLGD